MAKNSVLADQSFDRQGFVQEDLRVVAEKRSS